MNQTKTTAGSFNGVFRDIAAGMASVYVVVMLCFFPFYTTDYYFDILRDRFDFYWKCTLVTAVFYLLLFLVYAVLDAKENAGINVKEALVSMKPARLVRRLTVTDWCFLALIVIMFISMVASGYPYETFWGNRGRYQGVLSWVMYGITYLIITRAYRYQPWHLRAFLFTGMLVCLWGITDFFKLNLMHFLDDVPDGQSNIFVSSVGNINTYTNLTAVILAVAAVLFITDKKRGAMVYDFAAVLIAAFACVMGVSDNVVFSFAGLFAFLPFWAWRTKRGVARYFAVLAAALTAIAVTGMCVNAGIDNIAVHIGGSFFISFGQTALAPALAVLLWAVTAAVYAVYVRETKGTAKVSREKAAEKPNRTPAKSGGQANGQAQAGALELQSSVQGQPVQMGSWAGEAVSGTISSNVSAEAADKQLNGKKLRKSSGNKTLADVLDEPTNKNVRMAWNIFFALALIAVLAIVIDANTGGHPQLWEPFSNALIFNDDWGTHRGHNWRLAWEYFTQDEGWLQRFIGHGPDTYYIITMDHYYEEMISKYGEVYDSAHNEYLNYLMTVGIAGLAAYLGMMGSGLWSVFRKKTASASNHLSAADLCPGAAASAFAAIAYGSQALVNIAVPLTLPTVFTIVFIGFAIAKRIKSEPIICE